MSKRNVIIIGGGAAGFFAAINLARSQPNLDIHILEKSAKLLSKVRISGGGRCNVTHHCLDNELLVKNYPRGSRELRQVFARFAVEDTIRWFSENGVQLKTEQDGRMFPVTDSSSTIIDCFTGLAAKHGIKVMTSCEVFTIRKSGGRFLLTSACGDFEADAVICASGGHPKKGSYNLLQNLGHTIVEPVPSLFTFNLPGEKISQSLQGLAVQNATVALPGVKLKQSGPLLITHWGLSGPAVLKLSAFAAEQLHEQKYHTTIIVNWVGMQTEEVIPHLLQLQMQRKQASPYNTTSLGLPARLWEHFCGEAGIDVRTQWAGVSKKHIHTLAQRLSASSYQVQGKTTFKEEFVTCGGVLLREVDFRSMESKVVPGLYLCGEVLNIDGVTGGFNFQAAWSTAWLSARSAAEKLK